MQRRQRRVSAEDRERDRARAGDRAAGGQPVGDINRDRAVEVTALSVVDSGMLLGLPRGERILLGSGLGCDIVLDDPEISAAHCVIERVKPGQTVLRDDGSASGTFVNGARVRTIVLRPGALVRLGSIVLVALGAERHGPGGAFGRLVGQNPAFRSALATAMRAAVTDCSVLVLGETGTGKELMAQAIHEASPRSAAPLVALNCGAIASQLIGSELFGHEKGSFTGAAGDRDGMFVHACGGTLFLDELGELPLEQQPHLLRVLETRHVRRLGSNCEQPIDVRLIAATNRMDAPGSSSGRLRLDLYHRLATVIIELPPLRARTDDIPLLVRAFMDEFAPGYGPREIRRRTLNALCEHPWPGNVRELRAAVQRAMALCPHELALDQLLPRRAPAFQDHPVARPSFASRAAEPGAGRSAEPGTSSSAEPGTSDDAEPGAGRAAESGTGRTASITSAYAASPEGDCITPMEIVVRERMRYALMRCGSIRRAAQALGMPKSTFADRARRLGVLEDPARRRCS
jgi:DNA-binding NtrC family response regulator